MLAIGEVRTGLVQSSGALPLPVAARALGLVPGERVRTSERPIAYAVSPERLAGLDCRLATRSGTRLRGVGTAVTRAAITGGRVLQGSTHTALVRARTEGRLPWAHYLARPGMVETAEKARWDDLADGFLGGPQPSTLDLGALNERVLDDIVLRPELDRRPPFRARRTTLRWVAEPPEGDAGEAGNAGKAVAHFALASSTLRTARLSLPAVDLPAVVGLCEDLALHDWLLTTLVEMVERSRLGSTPGQAAVDVVRPAVDHLLHLWMPAARVDPRLLPVWHGLERQPGFTRQWDVSVHRIRDQIAVTTVGLLGVLAEGDVAT